MKMLAPFGLKYSRPQCVFLPRNLCIMRGEIDYVASNRSIDPRGVRSTPPMECLISGTGWMAGIGHDQTHHSLGPTSALGLGRVKTPMFNLRVEIPSRFRKFENQK